MKWSNAFIFTQKDAPADAEIPSHQLLARGGYIKKLAPGIYTLQNLALRVLRNLEEIIRSELDQRGCTEILMPVVQPQEIWEESKRWSEVGDLLLKFKNRSGHGFCLGATHEEVVTDIVRRDVKSYRDLPVNLYQIQTKYRDEIRPRFGLMRGREFIMKDAYSFDLDKAGALKSYELMREAYTAIFKRTGLDFRIVKADAGNIGGSQTHEFQVLANAGEDHLMVCSVCDFAANVEIAPAFEKLEHTDSKAKVSLFDREEISTPRQKTIADLSKFLNLPANELVKTLFVEGPDQQPICVLLRGSDELNPIKLKNVLQMPNPPLFLTEEEVKKLTGAWPGSCGPVGLKIKIIADQSLRQFTNFVVGANKDDFHLKNVNFERDFKVDAFEDIRMAVEGHLCLQCEKGRFKSLRGIEVGHIFYLGTKYSKAMGANYLNSSGQSTPIEMGCYGIGVTRTLQAAVEQNHDKDGIVWPFSIAPFHVHICLLDPKSELVSSRAYEIYNQLKANGLNCLLDDREERPGVKFKDADLLGMPIRLNLGEKGFSLNEMEVIERKEKKIHKVAPDKAIEFVLNLVREKWNFRK
jgi:prolyl-tRNA synthetase